MDDDVVEMRVLGCLIEKQRTTPDHYPLSLNALRLAANQATNRDPVVDYDDATIRAALDRLGRRGWTRLTSGPSSRTAKFRHLVDEALQLTPSQLALLAVLMLRGPQTLGELRTRSERLFSFRSTGDVEIALGELAARGFAERLPKRPGEREERWAQLLGPSTPRTITPPGLDVSDTHAADPDLPSLEERLARLERTVADLLRRIDDRAP